MGTTNKKEQRANRRGTPVQHVSPPKRPARWPDGTPRSTGNAFTGDFPKYDSGPSRGQVLNGQLPQYRGGYMPWDGPLTDRKTRK